MNGIMITSEFHIIRIYDRISGLLLAHFRVDEEQRDLDKYGVEIFHPVSDLYYGHLDNLCALEIVGRRLDTRFFGIVFHISGEFYISRDFNVRKVMIR